MEIPLPRVATEARRRALTLEVALRLALAGTVIAAFVVRSRRALTLVDYPLNDGGMFYTMIHDLRAAHYLLPAVTSYNLSGIPFAYPPLGFYLSALVQDALGVRTVDVLRVLPPVLATLVVVAYVPLARALSRGSVPAAVATFVVAMQPSAFTWLVMGGGLTRALGLFLATAALVTLHRLYTRGDTRWLVASGLLAGLTLLAHVEMAWFLAFSGALFLGFYARDRRRALAASVAVAGIAVAIAAPWWVSVLMRHGPAPFIAAATTGSLGNPVTDLLAFQRTDEPLFPIIAALGLLGLVACVLERRWAVPAWLLATALLDQRSFNALSALQLGLLAGVAVTEVIAPLTRDRRLLAVVGAAAAAYLLVAAGKADQALHRAITADERAAMAWVREATAPDATVLVVSQRFWAGDRVAEWLPAIARRRVVDTVQGTEWLQGSRGFARTLQGYDAAQQCADETGGCLLGWARAYTPFDYVYLPKTIGGYRSDGSPAVCCAALRLALRSDPAFQLVYDGPGATVFRRVGGEGNADPRTPAYARKNSEDAKNTMNAPPTTRPAGT